MNTPSAADLMLAKQQLNINVDNVDTKYTWFPGLKSVYIGTDIKSNWLHSLWVGVVMTVLSLPAMIWDVIVRPLLSGLLAVVIMVVARVIGGLSGRASGIEVDEQSFYNEVGTKVMQAAVAQFALQDKDEDEDAA